MDVLHHQQAGEGDTHASPHPTTPHTPPPHDELIAWLAWLTCCEQVVTNPEHKCELGECHGIIDDTQEKDADAVEGSNSCFQFRGCNPRGEEGDLRVRGYPCFCSCCMAGKRNDCPFRCITGAWEQRTCQPINGAGTVRQKQSLTAKQVIQWGACELM